MASRGLFLAPLYLQASATHPQVFAPPLHPEDFSSQGPAAGCPTAAHHVLSTSAAPSVCSAPGPSTTSLGALHLGVCSPGGHCSLCLHHHQCQPPGKPRRHQDLAKVSSLSAGSRVVGNHRAAQMPEAPAAGKAHLGLWPVSIVLSLLHGRGHLVHGRDEDAAGLPQALVGVDALGAVDLQGT